MSNTAIKVEQLSKRYRIGLKEELHDTFIGALASWVKYPFSNFKRVQNLSKFDENIVSEDVIWALKDVSFEVERGEVVGIIGRNGAGKTTLLKILSRITEPTKGYGEIHGRVVSLLEVGTGFHPELTGRENIYLNAAILGMKKAEIASKFDEIVDFADIERFLDTPVKRYSSGMYIRLAFSVAAHLEPEVLMIDEVLAVGDAEFQKKCLGKMESVAKEGRTVLFVSHNMIAIENLCNKGIVLNNGRMKFNGNINEAVESYMTGGKTEYSGEESWQDKENAPGNHQVKLKAIRIVSDGKITGTPGYDHDIEIQIDYWNLTADERRLVSLHVHDVMGILLFTSGNMTSVSSTHDEWCYKKYPEGLFRTNCIIPKELLNTGIHSLSLYINGLGSNDNILLQKHVISFEVKEIQSLRKEYYGKWLGAVRPKLSWKTEKLE